MKTYYFLLVSFLFNSVVAVSQEYQDQLPPKEKWNEITALGKVLEIDKENRAITVMGLEGNFVTVTVGDEVERFDELAVDDIIEFEYLEYILAEFRWPTPEELAEPLMVLAEGGKAPEGMDPGAYVGAIVKAVVTIEIINRPNMTATVQGPRGNYMTFDVEDKSLLERVNVGQVVILTYAEAMALSLNKVNPSK